MRRLLRRRKDAHRAGHERTAVAAVESLVGDPEERAAPLALPRVFRIVPTAHRVPRDPDGVRVYAAPVGPGLGSARLENRARKKVSNGLSPRGESPRMGGAV
jgi:hypothetical protein